MYKRPCSKCGVGFWTTQKSRRRLCGGCKQMRYYTVVFCPDDEYGYPQFDKGTRFTKDHIEETLRMGHFPVGMRVHYGFSEYMVEGESLEPQKLVRLGKA